VTVGRGGSLEHLRRDPQELQTAGVEFHRAGRGGEVTYHGPGQLVAYPILKLEEGRRDLHRYLRDLEQVVIDVCAEFAVPAQRDPGRTGIWVEGQKLASIGIRASSWVVSHGVAINYGPDLSGFDHIVPCGLSGVQMTSLHVRGIARESLEQRFCEAFSRIFSRRLERL
jgi:lipoyl(octanoyl) transferase